MKNPYLLIVLALCCSSLSYSQGFKWGTNAGSTSNDYGRGVTTDEFGNYFSFGLFTGTMSFDSAGITKNINSAGGYDMVLIKYDCKQDFLWAVTLGGTSDEWGGYAEGDIASDASSNIYVTGKFWGNCKFNSRTGSPVTLSSSGFSDAFVAKYNKDGALQWVQKIGSVNREQGVKVHATPSGDVYATGDFGGFANFSSSSGAGQNVTNIGAHDIYLAKYNTNGELQWASQAGGTGESVGHGVAVDENGNSYITGLLSYGSGTVSFGSHSVSNSGAWGCFIAKCNSGGSWDWAVKAGDSYNETGSEIRADKNGNVYVAGNFESSTNFTSTSGSPVNVVSNGGVDAFLAKYNTNGVVSWVKVAGGSGLDAALGIAIDNAGNPSLGGYFNGTATFGSGATTSTLNSAGNSDIFVAKYDANGNLKWAGRAGGTGVDELYDMELKKTGNIMIIGSMSGNVNFGSSNLTSKGQWDMVIAELHNDYSFAIKGESGLCPGESTMLDAGINNADSYTWLLNGSVVHTSASPTYAAVTAGSYKVLVSFCDQADTSEEFVLGTNQKPAALNISGVSNSSPNSQETYSVSQTTGSTYTWIISGGTQVGTATNTILVQWSNVITGTVQVFETNSSGCHSDTASLSVSIGGTSVGPEITAGRIDITIYPVPSCDELNFRFAMNHDHQVIIMNSMGQEVLSQKLHGIESTIDISKLSSGVYFVLVADGKGYSAKRFQKQ